MSGVTCPKCGQAATYLNSIVVCPHCDASQPAPPPQLSLPRPQFPPPAFSPPNSQFAPPTNQPVRTRRHRQQTRFDARPVVISIGVGLALVLLLLLGVVVNRPNDEGTQSGKATAHTPTQSKKPAKQRPIEPKPLTKQLNGLERQEDEARMPALKVVEPQPQQPEVPPVPNVVEVEPPKLVVPADAKVAEPEPPKSVVPPVAKVEETEPTDEGRGTPEMRKWTDVTGTQTIVARFDSKSVDGKVIVLDREFGGTLSIPLLKLSELDRAYVKDLEAKTKWMLRKEFKGIVLAISEPVFSKVHRSYPNYGIRAEMSIAITNERREKVDLRRELPYIGIAAIDNYGVSSHTVQDFDTTLSGESYTYPISLILTTHEWADRVLLTLTSGQREPIAYCELVKKAGEWTFSKSYDDPKKLDVDKWLKEPRLEPDKPKAEAAPKIRDSIKLEAVLKFVRAYDRKGTNLQIGQKTTEMIREITEMIRGKRVTAWFRVANVTKDAVAYGTFLNELPTEERIGDLEIRYSLEGKIPLRVKSVDAVNIGDVIRIDGTFVISRARYQSPYTPIGNTQVVNTDFIYESFVYFWFSDFEQTVEKAK